MCEVSKMNVSNRDSGDLAVMRGNRRGAFTLVELLVVIAVIAVLAAILFPVFKQAKDRAQATRCINNLRQQATAMKMYGNDWNGRFPVAWHFARGKPSLPDVLMPYVKSTNVFHCPQDTGLAMYGGSSTPFWKLYDGSSYAWPAEDYSKFGLKSWPWLSGLSQDHPYDPKGVKLTPGREWIWKLPLRKRMMIYDYHPWHFRTRVVRDVFQAKGLNNVVFVDGHAESITFDLYIQLIQGTTPL